MMNPLLFDQSMFQKGLGKMIADNRHSFVRFCAAEFSLENYIAYMCVAAYRKSPTLVRLQTFYVAFLKPDSPLSINVSSKDAAPIVQLATVAPPSQRGFLGRILGPSPDVLDAVEKEVVMNLSDTQSRWKDSAGRYNMTLFGPIKRSEEVLAMMKTTTTGAMTDNCVKALGILESGGFPVRHMGLTGVVPGF